MKIFNFISIILGLATLWVGLVCTAVIIYFPGFFEFLIAPQFLNNVFLFPLIPLVVLVWWWRSGRMDISLGWKKFNSILGVMALIILALEMLILYEGVNSVRY
jgi:hypothetical protein